MCIAFGEAVAYLTPPSAHGIEADVDELCNVTISPNSSRSEPDECDVTSFYRPEGTGKTRSLINIIT